MNFLFFLFPFLLYLGIALQGLSYYLIGIVIPSLFFILNRKKIPTYFIKIGGIFIFLHVIFPITNFLIYFFPNTAVSQSIYKIGLKWPGILQSNFPSSLFFGGLALILFTLISKKRSVELVIVDNFQPLKSFLHGLTYASLVFLGLMLYCHYTGLDLHTIFRKKVEYLSKDDAFATGGYRVFGFYGHPLTIAGVCLTYAIFSWTLLCSFLANRNSFTWTFLRYKDHKYYPVLFLAIITFSNEICLILSGGRTATVVGVALLIIIPLFLNLRKNFFITLVVIFLIGITSFFIAKKAGILERIDVAASSIVNNDTLDPGNYRQYFWRTYEQMFLDKPIFGQGNYWLKQGVREEYYNKLGYEKLPEKYIAHNVYLETLGSVGLFGFIWIVAGLVYLFRMLKKQVFYQESSLKPVSLALIFSFIANLLHAVTQNVFFDSSVVYIYIGLIVVIMWESTNSQNDKKLT